MTLSHWEGEPSDSRLLTYSNLQTQGCQVANALTSLILVAVYLPLIPEAVIAILVCAQLGIMHNVVFGGFAAHVPWTQIANADTKLLIVNDG